MTNLERLIQELCPSGVEYKKLGDVATISRGGNFQKKDFVEQGVPCIHYGQIYTKYGLFVDSTLTFISEENAKKQKMAVKNDVIMAVTSENIEDVCKSLAWLGDEDVAVSAHSAIIHHTLNPKYLVYYLHTEQFNFQKRKLAHGTKVIEVTPDRLNDVRLPVPPLEVQREIVNILDSFTLLTAELTAELTARKKQYEFYRDKLLSFDTDVKIEPLGNVCDLQAGKAIKANLISDEKTSMASIPCFGANGLRGYVNDYNQEGNKSIIGRQGALCGNVCYATGKYYATEHAVVVTDKGYFNSRYLFHALIHADLNQYKTAGAQPGLSVSRLNDVKIAVPNKEVQDRIADVLDNFEKICTDLNIGLPAEIEARQKQYEYYRDLLLTFAETGSTLLTDRQTELSVIKLIQYVFGYVMLPLSKICRSISSGKAKTKDNIGKYPVYGSTGIIAKTNEAVYNKTNILVARVGANAGYTHLAEGCYDVSDNTLIIDVKNEYNLKYVYYQLVNMGLNRYAKGGGQPLVTAGQIKEVVIAIPAMREQERIVSILDCFDTLCNDLSAGLPAETEARQKQYEYYRDKLLSFKELS
ncbi:MAG: restriction endonuclease subunit S [Butyrivibrio sp.]